MTPRKMYSGKGPGKADKAGALDGGPVLKMYSHTL
jgi:hypothetical protein